MDALGEPVGPSGAGEQFQKEVGVVLVIGSQSFGDYLDRGLATVADS